jgi:hypothetical protein
MRENDIMSIVDDKEVKLAATVTEVPPLGYGNKESKISYAKQMESGELTAEIAGYAAELINGGECMQDITEEDDGCIDGRPAIEVLFVDENGNLATREIVDASNHERAKVAGGGYMTTLAMKRALDVPAGTVDEDLANVVGTLTREKVYCGAHTGQHGHGEATDCGANDKFQPILQNGILYRQEISETTSALLGAAGIEYEATIGDKVLNGWSETLTNNVYFAGSTGASRFTVIEQGIRAAQEATGDFAKPVAVSKHLNGDHKEDFIVINYIEGKTFSQRLFAEKMREKFPDVEESKLAQAFVVDVPRIVKLAQAFTKERENSEDDFKTALYAGVMYQLATAATLTDGSLRNFIISE